MTSANRIILFLVITMVILQGCAGSGSLSKRVHRKGYYLELFSKPATGQGKGNNNEPVKKVNPEIQTDATKFPIPEEEKEVISEIETVQKPVINEPAKAGNKVAGTPSVQEFSYELVKYTGRLTQTSRAGGETMLLLSDSQQNETEPLMGILSISAAMAGWILLLLNSPVLGFIALPLFILSIITGLSGLKRK